MYEHDRDQDSAPVMSRRQFAAAVLGLLAALLLMGVLGTFPEMLELQEICDEDTCEIDRRPWAQRHVGLLSMLAATVVALFGCLIREHLSRRRARISCSSVERRAARL